MLTPREMFELGSFGGTYWRPIYSSVTKTHYKRAHKKHKFLNKIPLSMLTSSEYDKTINRFEVKVGTSLEFWEDQGWITEYDPYGWVQWYCNFY
jgi:hypothetical protein